MTDKNGYSGSGAAAAVAAAQPVALVDDQPGVTSEVARTVHLIPMQDGHEALSVSTLCGARLNREEFETVNAGQGMRCTACVINQMIAAIPAAELPPGNPDSGISYQSWGWPVTNHCDQIRLHLHGEVSAIAIPIPLSTEVTRILTARHCTPAVLAHPYASDYHIVLSGEKYGIPLPWPPKVHQFGGALMLPPTVTPRGGITWVRPPCKDSLRLSREIDVFGALRAVLR
ncbi:MAG: hypothetical protein ACRDS1_15220 [Pseudonocardiaceae bacterium]